MPLARGTAKVVGYKKESSWGVPAGATGGKQLRRVTASFNLTKETYESNEIRTDRQVADFRHGVRSAEGSLNGELSSQSYSDFMQSLLARDFAAKTALTGLSVTIDAVSGNTYTVTRSTGSWLADNVKVGMVCRLSGAGLSPSNVNVNLFVAGVTALDLTVVVLNGATLVEEGPIAATTVSFPGRNTYIPRTGHTDDSYTIEEWYSDIAQSEVFTGMKVGSMAVQLPSTGLATVDFSFMGRDMAQTGTTQYFTSPTAQGSDGIYAAVNGVVIVGGAPVAVITSADFNIERGMESAQVVGSNSVADIFTGRIRASGNLSVFFTDAEFRNLFDDETPVTLAFAFTEGSENNADVISFVFPKVKMGSFTKEDNELGITASTSFTALLNDVTGTGLEETTVMIQDTAIAP